MIKTYGIVDLCLVEDRDSDAQCDAGHAYRDCDYLITKQQNHSEPYKLYLAESGEDQTVFVSTSALIRG